MSGYYLANEKRDTGSILLELDTWPLKWHRGWEPTHSDKRGLAFKSQLQNTYLKTVVPWDTLDKRWWVLKVTQKFKAADVEAGGWNSKLKGLWVVPWMPQQWNDGEHSLEWLGWIGEKARTGTKLAGGDREVWGESLQLETGYCKSYYSDANCVHTLS